MFPCLPDQSGYHQHNGSPGDVRQWIDSATQTLTGQLNLEDHRTRTLTGMLTHAAQHLWALTAGSRHNWTTNLTTKQSTTAHDH